MYMHCTKLNLVYTSFSHHLSGVHPVLINYNIIIDNHLRIIKENNEFNHTVKSCGTHGRDGIGEQTDAFTLLNDAATYCCH